jgi:hypothetical protein
MGRFLICGLIKITIGVENFARVVEAEVNGYDIYHTFICGVAMKRTVYLPEDLEVKVTEYLQQNPQFTFSRLIQESLETRLSPRDLSPLLKLAGVVTEAGNSAASTVEDDVVVENRL